MTTAGSRAGLQLLLFVVVVVVDERSFHCSVVRPSTDGRHETGSRRRRPVTSPDVISQVRSARLTTMKRLDVFFVRRSATSTNTARITTAEYTAEYTIAQKNDTVLF